MLVKKIPLLDHKNYVVGIINFLTEIPDTNLAGIVRFLFNLDIEVTSTLINNIKTTILRDNPVYGTLSLTTREEECLYYLLRGMTAKEIGKILGISFRTIEIYLGSIKAKFNCSSKATLIIKAMQLGCMQLTPISILTKIKP